MFKFFWIDRIIDVKRLFVILFVVFPSPKLLDGIFIGEGAKKKVTGRYFHQRGSKIFTHVFLNYHVVFFKSFAPLLIKNGQSHLVTPLMPFYKFQLPKRQAAIRDT